MTNKSEIRNGIQYKQCCTCKQLKPVSSCFYKMAHGRFGVTSECRKCGIERSIEHRRAHPEYQRNRYKNDPEFREKVKQWSREWKKRNPDRQKEWIKANPDYTREQQRRFRKAHPDYYKKLREMKLYNSKR